MFLSATLFTTYLLAGSVTSAPSIATLNCTDIDLEFVLLVEATLSLEQRYPESFSSIQRIVEYIVEKFPSARIGLASFTDKPYPFRGQGQYGNYQNAVQDYCYKRHVPLATYDNATLKEGLKEISEQKLSGLDAMQGQLEGMLFSVYDSQMNWKVTDDNECHFPAILVFTASKQHRPNDASSARNDWNWDRTYPKGYDEASYGGFGSHDFPSLKGLHLASEEDTKDYEELAGYFRIIDGFAAGAPGFETNITEAQLGHFQKLIEKFGPYPFPPLQYPTHPGDASVQDCSLTEYPGPSKVGQALATKSITPAFFVTPNVYTYYQTELLDLGVDSVILQMETSVTPEDLAATLLSQLEVPESQRTSTASARSSSTSTSAEGSRSTSADGSRSTSAEGSRSTSAAGLLPSEVATSETASEKSVDLEGQQTADIMEVSTTTEVVLDSGLVNHRVNVEFLAVICFVFFKML